MINNVLRGTGIDPQWNFATHSSNVAYGTWEFDVHVTDTPDVHFYVYLISFYGVNYRFSIFTDAFAGWTTGPEFVLLKTHGGSTTPIGRYDPGGAITGWYHFEVSRDETGHFEVSIDGVLRMELDDNDITQSNYFIFASQNGPGIDNIEVSDLNGGTTGTTGTTGSTPPPGIPGFPWLAILIAIPLALGVAISRKKS